MYMWRDVYLYKLFQTFSLGTFMSLEFMRYIYGEIDSASLYAAICLKTLHLVHLLKVPRKLYESIFDLSFM